MKISSYTQILVLVCLGAAFASFLLVKNKFEQYEQATSFEQQLLSSRNDINVSQTMLSQWFTTIDLYFTDHQTYLANGIAEQTEQILKRLDLIEKITIQQRLSQQQQLLQQLKQRVSNEARNIQKMSFGTNNSLSDRNQQLKTSDTNTQVISELFYSLSRAIELQHDNARQASQKQGMELKYHTILITVGYLIIVMIAVYQTSRKIIKPLEQLTRLTEKNGDPSNIESFKIDQGPKEIQQLANSFQSLYQQIAQQMNEALSSQTAARQAKERLKELVDNISLSILTIDTDGHITSFNPSAIDLFKMEASQLKGHQITELIPNLNINGGLFKQILNAGIDIELDAVSGKQIKPIELSCAEFTYNEGPHHSKLQYTLILHDISNRKWNEDRVKKLNQRLINTSRQAGIAEIATSILHSVGNVLNSVNTSISVLQMDIENDKIEGIRRTAQMLEQQGASLFEPSGKGPQLIAYLYAVVEQLKQDKEKHLKEIMSLNHNVHHIAEIVSAQQKFSGKSGIIEPLNICELIEEALNINVVSLETNKVEIIRQYQEPLNIMGDRSKIIQILVNLIRNANEAMITPKTNNAHIKISGEIADQILVLQVQDNGYGIEQENMVNMFRYGFTTKEDGHGFGLHSCALAAKEMHGALTVHSEGKGQGATFKLSLPVDPDNRNLKQIEEIMGQAMEQIND